jgi:DNA-binding NtrC family response regulator
MFLNTFNRKYKVSRTLGQEVLSVLETYDWPGNIRELQNVVERMVVTADTDVLTPRHLPNRISETVGASLAAPVMPGTMNLKRAREMVEREMIQRALAATGNTRDAARLLGVDHSTVVRKARRYGLNLREKPGPASREKASRADTEGSS